MDWSWFSFRRFLNVGGSLMVSLFLASGCHAASEPTKQQSSVRNYVFRFEQEIGLVGRLRIRPPHDRAKAFDIDFSSVPGHTTVKRQWTGSFGTNESGEICQTSFVMKETDLPVTERVSIPMALDGIAQAWISELLGNQEYMVSFLELEPNVLYNTLNNFQQLAKQAFLSPDKEAPAREWSAYLPYAPDPADLVFQLIRFPGKSGSMFRLESTPRRINLPDLSDRGGYEKRKTSVYAGLHNLNYEASKGAIEVWLKKYKNAKIALPRFSLESQDDEAYVGSDMATCVLYDPGLDFVRAINVKILFKDEFKDFILANPECNGAFSLDLDGESFFAIRCYVSPVK